MSFFTTADYKALTSGNAALLRSTQEKLLKLHQTLHPQLRTHHMDLHPRPRAALITQNSAASPVDSGVLTLAYFRPMEQAEMVEQLMGREGFGDYAHVEYYRHPVIELRLSPRHFAVELVLSPDAWWDQQNLVGKLALDKHRTAFQRLLHEMNDAYVFGFWGGAHLSDMHLTMSQLTYGSVLERWMGTFAEGQDWVRVGTWYEHDSPLLSEDQITHEVFTRIRGLYPLYEFALWTSDNNFRAFYGGGQKRPNYAEDRT